MQDRRAAFALDLVAMGAYPGVVADTTKAAREYACCYNKFRLASQKLRFAKFLHSTAVDFEHA